MTVVSNYSPLIALARIGQFELLRLLNDLIAAGFCMNEELYRTALELAGEV